MKFKHRIWLLPVMTAVIVTVGIAINSRITSNTSSALGRVENVQYPSVESLRTMRLAVVDVQESLQRAVAEGDQQAIAAADQHAGTVRDALKELAAVDAQSKLPRELGDTFDAYYAAALSATRIMLGTENGDSTQAIARMQKTSEKLMGVLTQSQEAAITEFRTLLAVSTDNVQRSLVVSLAMAAVTLLALGGLLVPDHQRIS